MKKKILVIFLLAALWLGHGHPARAESGVEISAQPPNYTFGGQITFQATITPGISIQNIRLIVESPGLPSFVGDAKFTPPDQITYVYVLPSRPLRAFSTITYHYRVALENGEVYTSPNFSFRYEDNRYTWQVLEDDAFRIHWYEGEMAFAQEILDTARNGKANIETLLSKADTGNPINIYAYASASELQSTLLMSGQTWVAGHADPELGAIAVSLPTGTARSLEIRRQVPHELAHILLYRMMGEGYQSLPRWLNEGIASQMELYPNSDYPLYLEKAYRENRVIPIEQLCRSFPSDAATSFLAYAEANSLTGYIKEYYGEEGIRNLILAYETGVGCARGVEIALGRELPQLEKDWLKATFDQNKVVETSGKIVEAGTAFLPWLTIFAAVFAPMTGFIILRNWHRHNKPAPEKQ